MAKDRFLVAPINSGVRKDAEPFLIPEDAFEQLNNAYIFRGRVVKRPGTLLLNDGSVEQTAATAQLSARLRVTVGTTNGSGNASGFVPRDVSLVPLNTLIGTQFSIGDSIYTVIATSGTMLDNGAVPASTKTYTTATGAYVFAGAPANSTIYWYPTLPVMGLIQYENASVNDEPTFAFDTRMAYQYSGNGWDRLGASAVYWTGNDSQFFWGRVWRGALPQERLLFVTNFNFGNTLNDTDRIYYYDGAFKVFNPRFSSVTTTSTVLQARIIIPFKNRLILMNVVENTGAAPGVNTQYQNRIRFSQNGNPVATDSFYEDIPGKGGYIDAPTQEQIISAEFVRDRLLVFFERSSYELVYTGNEILPFRFQKINDSLGVESTFSVVPFDDKVFGVGDVGVHATSSGYMERIDDQIPDFVRSIRNDNNATKRVHGIRDYSSEVIYWTFNNFSTTFPDSVALYNYKNKTWAFFEDSFTCFGYINTFESRVWQASLGTWRTFEDRWSSGGFRKGALSTIAGNQKGWVFVIDRGRKRNAPSSSITDFGFLNASALIINHNLKVGDYFIIENLPGVLTMTRAISRVLAVADANNIIFDPRNGVHLGSYTGGATIARISRPDVLTKRYNFYINKGYSCDVDKIDLYVERTGAFSVVGGLFGVSFSVESRANTSEKAIDSQVVQTYPYTDAFYDFELVQDKLWRTVHTTVEGSTVQFRYFLNDDQMADTDSVFGSFTIHAMIYHVSPTRMRLD